MCASDFAPPNRVTLIHENKIYFTNAVSDLEKWLKELGANEEEIEDEHRWTLPLTSKNKNDMEKALMVLRDRGFLFAGAPHGWPPAEVFRELRQEGFIEGAFKEMVYYRSGKWAIYSG